MSIRVVKLDRRFSRAAHVPEVGLLLTYPDGRRVAATGSRILKSEGCGHAIPPRNGIWLTNRPFVELQADGHGPPLEHLKADSWIGPEWHQILTEWGMGMPLREESVPALAEMVGRVVRIGILAAAEMRSRPGSGPAGWAAFRHPSLSSAIRSVIGRCLEETRPRQTALQEVSQDLHLFGTAGLPTGHHGRNLTLTFVRSRLGWIRMLAGKRVPSPGLWRRVELPEPPELLGDRLFGELTALGRPIIVVASFRPFTLVLPAWARCWVAGHAGSCGRRSFVLEEVHLLRSHGEFFVSEAFAGPGWRPVAESLLGRLSAELAKVCGGRSIAMLSWSAGLAAENLLLAAAAPPAGHRDSCPLETVWLAAHDRIAAVPAMEAADACGAALINGRAGTLRVRTRQSREAVLELIRSLWKLGWWPAGGMRGGLASIARGPAEFGGGAEERAIAVAMQHGPEGVAGRLDRLADLRPGPRRARVAELRLELDRLVA